MIRPTTGKFGRLYPFNAGIEDPNRRIDISPVERRVGFAQPGYSVFNLLVIEHNISLPRLLTAQHDCHRKKGQYGRRAQEQDETAFFDQCEFSVEMTLPNTIEE